MTISELLPGEGFGCESPLLTLAELCEWLSITERHARKMVERDAIPYRKVGRLLRFCRADVDAWSRPIAEPKESQDVVPEIRSPIPVRKLTTRNSSQKLPKSLLD